MQIVTFYNFIWKGSSAYMYVGCFVDTYTRVLPHQYGLNVSDHPDMENNRCLLYCKDQGYKYAGTQVILWKVKTQESKFKLVLC